MENEPMVATRVTIGSTTPTPYVSETLVPLRVADLLACDPPSVPPLAPDEATPVLLPRRAAPALPARADTAALEARLGHLERRLFQTRLAAAAAFAMATVFAGVVVALSVVTAALVL